MTDLSTQTAIEALKSVHDPTFERSLVDLGSVQSPQVEGHKVTVTIRIHSPSAQVRRTIEAAARQRLEEAGFSEIELHWDIRVPTRDTGGGDPVPGVRNLILVMSGKGGVGKSTVAANLALALARAGTRVGLLDADLYGPSIPTMMGIAGHPRATPERKIEPLQRFGIKLMSIGFLLEDPKEAVVWRGPMLHGALQQFLADVDWGELDYLILDLPPGTGDIALTLAQKVKITGAVMVTTPQEVALQDVLKGVSMCKKLNLPILGIVENMSFFVDPSGARHALFGSGGGQRVAEYARAPLLGQVPVDPTICDAGDAGTPIVQRVPASEAANAFARIAETLSEVIAKEHYERGGKRKAPSSTPPKRLRIVR